MARSSPSITVIFNKPWKSYGMEIRVHRPVTAQRAPVKPPPLREFSAKYDPYPGFPL